MIRSLFRSTAILSRRTSILPLTSRQLLTPQISFSFAKVSKKQQMQKDKKKQKSKIKEELGGNIEEVDLNKYEEKYDEIIKKYKEQLMTIRMGRLEPSSLSSIQIRTGGQSLPLNSLAQVNSKGANICAVSPFDSSQIDII